MLLCLEAHRIDCYTVSVRVVYLLTAVCFFYCLAVNLEVETETHSRPVMHLIQSTGDEQRKANNSHRIIKILS